jgi:two-component system cell cycle response regulator DivK
MSKRILVVEDQEDNRQIIRDLLSATDYEITEAESGEQALEAVAKQRPDLILMDIQLPGMDGYEATRRIKADPTLRSITIFAVTSYALSGEEQKARAAGCDEYVAKPYSPRQLLAKIRQYLLLGSALRRSRCAGDSNPVLARQVGRQTSPIGSRKISN